MATAFLCHRQSITDAGTLSFLITLLVSLGATDIRALCRRISPAEIVGLQGTRKFVHSEFMAACALSITGTAPLILYGTVCLGIEIIPAIALGLAIGFPVGTLVIPEQRNISAQCTATLLCLAVTVSVSKLTFIGDFNQVERFGFYLLLLASLLLLTAMTEYKRNPFTWSNYEQTKKH